MVYVVSTVDFEEVFCVVILLCEIIIKVLIKNELKIAPKISYGSF